MILLCLYLFIIMRRNTIFHISFFLTNFSNSSAYFNYYSSNSFSWSLEGKKKALMKATTFIINSIDAGRGLSNSAARGARIVRALPMKLHTPIAVALL